MAANENRVPIIGIGSDGLRGLTQTARQILEQAELVLGADRALDLLPELTGERYAIGTDLQAAVRTIQENLGRKRIAVVAIGDPLFYGVARYLCDRIGRDHFEVTPHVSTMQLAFARVKESWEDAYLTNLANHPLVEVIDRIRSAETVGMFPSDTETPAVIARTLLQRAVDCFEMYVCENLGSPDERVTHGELSDIVDMEFSPLSVVILRRKPGRPTARRQPRRFRRFGNPDDVFAQSQPHSGLITQAEVRALALAQLDLQPTSVIWDIGAGSGAVAIEAAQIAERGTVYAIEQEAADYHLILANIETFGVTNVRAVHGTAPAVFADLPQPDAIFVGGTGHEVARLLEAAFGALAPGGKLVVNVAALDTLHAAYDALKAMAGNVDATLVQIARGVNQLDTLRFEAVNPSFLLGVTKPLQRRPRDSRESA